MMKLSWSKKKHPYTPHSAPITNGILRNSKWAVDTNRSRNADRRVTFSFRRGNSQMSIGAIRAAMEGEELERKDGGYKKIRPSKENGQMKDGGSGNRRNQQGGRKIKTTTQTHEHGTVVDVTSELSECSFSDTRGSPYRPKPRRRLGDLPAENIADGYGKSESNGTIDTAETSDISEKRQRPRRRLSQLLDEKIGRKLRMNFQECEESSTTCVYKPFEGKNEANMRYVLPAENVTSGYGKLESNGTLGADSISHVREKKSRPRRRLSLLLDDKIEAKTQRNSQLESEESITKDVIPVVHKLKWNTR